MKSTGHDKVRVSVCLTGKAVAQFKTLHRTSAKRESKALQDKFHR